MVILPILNAQILLCISGIHFYWTIGGKWGLKNAVPEMKNKPAFKPGKIATLMVGFGLLVFALVHLSTLIYTSLLPPIIAKSILLIISGIFFLRAIGDFTR